jgi:hypothetical protein
MKWIAYNVVPILLICLAGAMIFTNKHDWGWVLFAGLLFAIFPSTDKK